MFCPKCGHVAAEGDDFCIMCGTPLAARKKTILMNESDPYTQVPAEPETFEPEPESYEPEPEEEFEGEILEAEPEEEAPVESSEEEFSEEPSEEVIEEAPVFEETSEEQAEGEAPSYDEPVTDETVYDPSYSAEPVYEEPAEEPAPVIEDEPEETFEEPAEPIEPAALEDEPVIFVPTAVPEETEPVKAIEEEPAEEPVKTPPVRERRPLPRNERPLSTWGFLWRSLLFMIPVINIIPLFVFAFAKGVNKNSKNFASAVLIIMLICLILVVAAVMLVMIYSDPKVVSDFIEKYFWISIH